MKSNKAKHLKGFTVVEILVALMVSSIILGAVASLAYALGRVSDESDDLSHKQAHLRYTTTRVSQLIRYSKLVCASSADYIALWRSDDYNGTANDKINPTEILYMQTGTDSNYIDLLEFDATGSAAQQEIIIQDIQTGTAKSWLFANCTPEYTRVVSQCTNLSFMTDMTAPDSGLVNISFAVNEGGVSQTYQISAALRGRAANLLYYGVLVSDDD
jgi:prepilin-type N-terminal cleavage/methylation domain-containing protein